VLVEKFGGPLHLVGPIDAASNEEFAYGSYNLEN